MADAELRPAAPAPADVIEELLLHAVNTGIGLDGNRLPRYLEAWYSARRLMEDMSGDPLPSAAPVDAGSKVDQPTEPAAKKYVKNRPPTLAERKRKVVCALEARKELGYSLQTVADAAGGALTINDLLDMLQGKVVPVALWDAAAKALRSMPREDKI